MRKVLILLAAISSLISASDTCKRIRTEYGINCECTEDFCDNLQIPEPENENQFIFITSSYEGDRFAYQNGQFTPHNCSKLNTGNNLLFIDQDKKHDKSKVIGFGGGFTGAVSYILSRFSPKLREHFYQSYFSRDIGIGYNILRIPIGGSDFDFEPWTYAMQLDNDTNLSQFAELEDRDKVRNMHIKEIKSVTKNDEIKVLGAAWSPPRWMKAKNEWWGKADNQLIPAFYQTWADYHVKWVNLMKQDGVPVWGVSTGNEPYFAVHQKYGFITNSWDPGNQAEWLIDNLAPALKQSENSDIKIHIFDDSRHVILEYLEKMIERRPNVMDYVDFIDIHGYADFMSSPQILDFVHDKYVKQILYTEMCFDVLDQTVKPGSWSHAEKLTINLLESLEHNVGAYIDWNMILDSKGGPSYINATINPYILANENFTAFYKQPLYYTMAHFAKFLLPNSIRIDSKFHGANISQVHTLAYLRPDKKVTIIVYNNNTNSVTLTLVDDLKGWTQILLKPKSLNTILYSNKN